MNKALTKDMFENIIVMFVSEPGAMGPNTMEFMNDSGEVIDVAYTVENKYEILREAFPLLKECRWDGPMANEKDSIGGIKIGGEFSTKDLKVGNTYIWMLEITLQSKMNTTKRL